jgi:hypothetical protein
MNLTYTGKGRAVVGIPATDLTDDELAALAKRRNVKAADLRRDLIASGVYAEKGKEK